MNTKAVPETIDITKTALIALDPKTYVAAVYAPFRDRLDTAKSAAAAVTQVDATTSEGMQVARTHRATLRTIRVEIEKAREERKAPILEIGRLLDGRARELRAEIEPEENRFDVAIKAEEGRREREKAEREAAELARVTHIHACIAEINQIPAGMVGKPSSRIAVVLTDMQNRDVTPWAQEFQPTAEQAKQSAIAALQQLFSGALATEKAADDERARVEAERAELARLRAEKEERDRQEQEQRAADARRRAEEEAVHRARLEAEERAARLQREAADTQARLEREAEEAKLRQQRAAEDRARAEKDAQERQERAAREAEERTKAEAQAREDARLRAESERLAAEKREIERRQEEVLAIDRLIGVLRERIKGEKRYAIIAKAIEAWYVKQTDGSPQ